MKMQTSSRIRKHERGVSLLETMIAAVVMLIGIGGVMSLFTVAAMKNMSQGTQATRCTEYAQDKMEQLMALDFNDPNADTTQVPTLTGLTASGKGLTPGGTAYPSTPTAKYVDYVTEGTGTGSAIYAAKQNDSAYLRQWTIVPTSDAKIRTITVTVASLRTVDQGATPITTLVSQKTQF